MEQSLLVYIAIVHASITSFLPWGQNHNKAIFLARKTTSTYFPTCALDPRINGK